MSIPLSLALHPPEGPAYHRKRSLLTWHLKPPPLQQPPTATSPNDLRPLLLPLITKGVIKEVPSQPCYPSRVFTVPKPQGGKRLIINLSSLNLHIPCPSFKMLVANKIRHAITKQTFFTSQDITDAFHHTVPKADHTRCFSLP